MSSSYVEVREAENGTEENALPIAIDTCESNGIVPVNQIDGEPQKDHTYNKEPLEVQGEVEVMVSSEEVEEDLEVSITSPDKAKNAKKQRSPSRKTNKVARSSVRKESPKKAPLSPQKKVTEKGKDKTEEAAEKEEPVSDSEEKLDASLSDKDSSPIKKRGQKRKAETDKDIEKEPKPKKEKIDVKKSKPSKPKAAAKQEEVDTKEELEQTENDKEKTEEEEVKDDQKAAEKKSPSKPVKKNLKTPSKTPKKTSIGGASGEDGSKLPKGWTRKVVQRKSGKTAGQFDVYIYSPDGKKLRSRPDVAAYLAKTNSPLTIDDFNFSFRAGGGSTQSTPPVKKSTPTPAKAKSASKASSVSGKKKTNPNNSKKGVRLVVKLNFSPKKRILSNYEEQEKTAKLGGKENSEGGKKATPQKSPAKKQKSQAKKKTTKQSPSKK